MKFRQKKTVVKDDLKSEEKFELIFRRYFFRLCCFANRYTKNVEESKEIVQDVFLQVWNKRSQLSFDDEIQFYLFRSVKNSCLNLLEHRRVENDYQASLYLLYSGHDPVGEHFMTLELKELNEHIEQAIGSLPDECRRIFLLSREKGLKYAEISKELNISVKTVETQMGRALSRLRAHLKSYLS